MLKSFLTIAWRNIIRHKIYASINVIGLALGMTCCLFIFLWVEDEKSVDNFHGHEKNIYTVYETVTSNGKTHGDYSTPIQFGAAPHSSNFLLEGLKKSIPEVKYQAFFANGYELPWGHAETFQAGEKKLKLEGSRAGEDFFKIFSYPLIEGNASTALKEINGIAISRKMAEQFFQTPDKAMGQILRYENQLDFKVSAVFENLPIQSSLKFDFLFNWDAQKKTVGMGLRQFSNIYRTR